LFALSRAYGNRESSSIAAEFPKFLEAVKTPASHSKSRASVQDDETWTDGEVELLSADLFRFRVPSFLVMAARYEASSSYFPAPRATAPLLQLQGKKARADLTCWCRQTRRAHCAAASRSARAKSLSAPTEGEAAVFHRPHLPP
jgi:hypothetical protein